MCRSVPKNIEKQNLAMGDNLLEAMDITNYSGCSTQIVGPAGGTGTLKLQASLDNLNWFDIAGASVALAGGKAIVQAIQLHYALVRPHINITAGPGDYKIQMLAKDF